MERACAVPIGIGAGLCADDGDGSTVPGAVLGAAEEARQTYNQTTQSIKDKAWPHDGGPQAN